MNYNSFVAFAKSKEGERLFTVAEGKMFSVAVVGDRMVFTPESGDPRSVSGADIRNFCVAFAERKSWKRSEYPETQSGSYLLGIARAFEGEKPNISHVFVPPESNFPDDILGRERYSEGALRRITVNAYERDSKARAACLVEHGLRCAVCSISFSEVYGEIGEGFIHVHHKKPLASIRSEYRVDPILDLIPVCPNCHAMLHARRPPFEIEELKAIVERKRRSNKAPEQTPGLVSPRATAGDPK